jgi:hypothetical protein
LPRGSFTQSYTGRITFASESRLLAEVRFIAALLVVSIIPVWLDRLIRSGDKSRYH